MESTPTTRGGRRVAALRRGAFALTVLGAALLAVPAHGDARPVQVGEIAAAVDEPGVEARLRDVVASELAALELPATSRRRYLLDVSLDELATTRHGARIETICQVSATLRDAEDDALLAILRGRARAEDSGPRSARVRALVLSGAVRSALSRVPAAVQR